MSSHSPSPGPALPRKAHTCRSCGLPMKGHQRGTCIQNGPLHPRASPPVMPPPVTLPPGPSQPSALFPSPGARPVMPGAYANERPSEASAATGHGFGHSPTRSLRDRIGAKVEENTTFDFNHYPNDVYDPLQYSRHASAPVHGYPSRMIAGSASGYAASASGSAFGSSSVVLPEHSVSQRFIRRDRTASDAPNSLSGRLADRLGGYTDEDFIGPDNDFDEDGSFEYDDSYDYESESDPAYPSDGSAIGGGPSASYYASESDAGTYTTSGRSSAPSFGALIRGSGAAPLYTVYEVASKYAEVLRNRARRKGLAVRVVPQEDDNELDEFGRRKRSSKEPGNVQILLGRDESALMEVERQHRAGLALTTPVRRIRMRTPTNNTTERHSTPHASPPPPQVHTSFATAPPGVNYPVPTVAVPQPQSQRISVRTVCLIATATIAVLVVLLLASVGFFVIFARPPSE